MTHLYHRFTGMARSCRFLASATAMLVASVFADNANAAALNFNYQGLRFRTDNNRTVAYITAPKDGIYIGDIVVPEIAVSTTVGELKVVGIYGSPFADNPQITSVELPATITEIPDYAFDSCEELLSVKMPGVTKIGNWSFRNCYKLENMEFPENLKSIGNYCFDKNLAQTVVDLPASVTNLGGFIWEGNPQITTFVCRAVTPPAVIKGSLDGEEIYTLFDDNDYSGRKLYVPEESINLYKAAYGWYQFKQEIYPLSDFSGASDMETDAIESFNVTVAGKSAIAVTSSQPADVTIVDLMGRLVRKTNVAAGTTVIDALPSGILIVNGKKVVL